MRGDLSVSPATRLVQSIERGDVCAAEELFPLVYDELRAIARAHMADLRPGQTLQPTALVHEAYLRLLGKPDAHPYNGTRHFFFAAARAMHDILVERARAKSSLKRGGRGIRGADGAAVRHERPGAIEPRAFRDPISIAPADMLALHEALQTLQRDNARRHQVVMLRFFAGLTTEQTASAMDLSTATVEREWRFARALLHEHLSGG